MIAARSATASPSPGPARPAGARRLVPRAVGWAAAALLGAASSSAAGGCVIDPPKDAGAGGPCSGRWCAKHGECVDDQCRCESGFSGNPWASHGCQPVAPAPTCDSACGLNASCQDGACQCADGFVAVCGTGDCTAEAALCDGTADCTNAADEDPTVCFETVVMELALVDGCDDGKDISWRLWSHGREWAWPGPDTVYLTEGFDVTSVMPIECLEGDPVCLGAAAGEHDWGVGLPGDLACDDCCEPCRAQRVDFGVLECH